MLKFEDHLVIEGLIDLAAADDEFRGVLQEVAGEDSGDLGPLRAFLRDTTKKSVLMKSLEYAMSKVTNQVALRVLQEFLRAVGSTIGKIAGAKAGGEFSRGLPPSTAPSRPAMA